MSKAGVIGAVVIIGIGVVGGGGYYYATQKANQELHHTIDLIQKSMPGSSLTYESSKVSPFSQSATLNKVVFKDDQGQTYTADTLTMSGVSKDKIGKISLNKFHTAIDGGTIDIDQIDASNVVAENGAILVENGKIKRVFPSKFSVDLLNTKNINIAPNQHETMTIAQYELKNYAKDRASDQLLKDITVKTNSDGSEYLKLNQVQLDGLNLAQMIASAEQGQTPKVIPGQPKKGILEGLAIKANHQSWALAKFETENSIDQNGNQKSSAVFSGLKMNTDHNPKLYALKKIGYDQIDASGKLMGSYDKSKQLWSFAPFELVIKDMGTLNANLEFNGSESLSNVEPEKLMSDYKLVSLKVTLQNQGLLQKIFEGTAKQQNISADQVKQQTIDMIKQDAEKAVIPVQKQGDEAIIELINDPKKVLVIDMKPTQPASFMELVGDSPFAIVGKLNLNVKAEAAK